ncbi:hypothetical protein ITX31_15145 [Arthrobacter gandavensis]|uniref:DUF6993 domain-containing protein n=1 Tax=Arthrobacter gandavensis TaxID=169960 RepID=UPI00188F2B75|nr:hypothetical protein [Arthrobacter gandavensis]MBF4995435.1 hypothetical protein [Arthrobacter gandavensis]
MMATAGSSVQRCRWAGVAAAVALAAALSGCAGADSSQALPTDASAGAGAGAVSDGTPLPDRFQAAGTALTELVAESPEPSRDAVRSAWVSAGFSAEEVEVSQDGTPTGLAVDAIVSAAPDGTECLIGEIRRGTLTMTTAPALASGQCLLGDDR